jgi:hypothetical protein
MKNIARIMIPAVILVVLVLATGSLAFAKEFGLLGRTPKPVELNGVVGSVSAEKLTVTGTDVILTNETVLTPSVSVGDTVQIQGQQATNGSISAQRVELVNRASSGVPSSSVGTIDDSISNNPSISMSSDLEITGTVESISADAWVVAGQTIVVTPETDIHGTIVVGDIVEVYVFLDAAGILTASNIELYTSDDDDCSDDHEYEFSGIVESISSDSWTIAGQVVLLTSATVIDGSPVVGDIVKVQAFLNADGTLTAIEIEKTGCSDGDCSDDDCSDDDCSDDHCSDDCGDGSSDDSGGSDDDSGHDDSGDNGHGGGPGRDD